MRICVLVANRAFDTGLSSVLDTLQTANELSPASSAGPAFTVEVCGVAKRVTTQQGLRLPLRRLPRSAPDVVIVPALGAKTADSLAAALEQREIADMCVLLREWSQAGALVGAACTATFVVAHAGLLDGRRATTSWWLGPSFRARFPRVLLEDSRIIVPARGFVTAGAALAHVDLALWLVRRHSPSLAQRTANFLTFDDRQLQTGYVMSAHVAVSDPLVEKFEHWARRNLAGFSLEAAARALGASSRTLERHVSRVLGKSPLAVVRELRVDKALQRLRAGRSSLEEIAAEVGYSDAVTLRTLLRRKTGRGLRELRR
jgi:transcriptional regulator GlxA family with amidase domain